MMSNLNKHIVVCFSIFVILCLSLVGSCVAPITVPAKPEAPPEIVSVKINSNHKYYPPTYSTNPYTGETTIEHYGQYYTNGTIEITIKNRPFTPYVDKDGHIINRYYTFFTRPGGDKAPEQWWDYWLDFGRPWYTVYQSDTDYTVITITYFPAAIEPNPHLFVMYEGSWLAFRVQAVTGYFVHDGSNDDYHAVYEGVGSEPAYFEISIPVSKGTNPKPTSINVVPVTPSGASTSGSSNGHLSSQQQFNLFIVIVFVCIVVAVLLAVIAYLRRQRGNAISVMSQSDSSFLFLES